MSRARLLRIVRYWLPAALVVAGFAALVAVEGPDRFEAFSMLVGSGLSVALLNVLFRYGSRGDAERRAEDDAREFYARHGHWPDEAPPPRRGRPDEAPPPRRGRPDEAPPPRRGRPGEAPPPRR